MAHRKSPTKKKWRHDNEKSPRLQAPGSYAREHDELAAYRASNQANTACKEAIEAAIRDHYRDNRLDAAAVDQVVQQFGYDRTFHVLAITVCQADWDRRYSPDNRAWANAMSIPANPDTWGTDRNCYLAVNSIPVWSICFSARPAKPTRRSGRKPLSGIS